MKANNFIISTLRENPQDATIASHRLMMRAGLIRKLGVGSYHLLPAGLRSFRKIENIVREEMNAAGAVEFELPILVPADLWKQSGRWDTMGREMFRLKDRHDADNVLGPTHEETFTELMAGILRSYKDLPVTVYQIHTKFRDEIRPRFGVMRSREFVMKDAYSFDRDEDQLNESYQKMRKAYRKIFQRVGLHTIPVEADTGAMGGSASEEFMVPSEIGEEVLLIADDGKYMSNQEKTPVLYPELQQGNVVSFSIENAPAAMELKKIHTPGMTTIEDVAEFLKSSSSNEIKNKETITARNILKSLVYMADGQPVLVCIRGDRSVNEVKLKNYLQATEVEPATAEQIIEIGSIPGFIGPEKEFTFNGEKISVVCDNSVLTEEFWIVGANEKDYHCSGFVFSEDMETVDLALAEAGDLSPVSHGVKLHAVYGVEVGHIFKLGDKYSHAFNVNVLDEKGKPCTPLMGCYGIGVNRTMAAVIEQSHDEKGIVWPLSVAPFEFVLVSISKKDEEVRKVENIYNSMIEAGFDLFWDNRDLRPGVKFADCELIGFPVRLTAGKTFFENGEIEILIRRTGKTFQIPVDQTFLPFLENLRSEMDREEKAAMEQGYALSRE